MIQPADETDTNGDGGDDTTNGDTTNGDTNGGDDANGGDGNGTDSGGTGDGGTDLPAMGDEGSHIWTYQLMKSTRSDQNGFGAAVATDSNGNIFVAGRYYNASSNDGIDFRADWPGTEQDRSPGVYWGLYLFLTKIAPDGSYEWSRFVAARATPKDMTVDADGNVYIVGIAGNLNIDYGKYFDTVSNRTGSPDWGGNPTFVLKVTASGEFGWARVLPGRSLYEPRITLCQEGENLYIASTVNASPTAQSDGYDFAADFINDTDIKILEAGNEAFLTKLSAAGGYVWTKLMQGPQDQYSRGVATDADGNVYWLGANKQSSFNFSADWETENFLSSENNRNGFVTKVNADGSYGWTKNQIGEDVFDLGFDGSGNLYITGRYATNSPIIDAYWGGTTGLPHTGGNWAAFVLRINNDGTYGGARAIGNQRTAVGYRIAVDSSGSVIVAGRFDGDTNFNQYIEDGNDTISFESGNTSHFQSDIFITRINPGWTYGGTVTLPVCNYISRNEIGLALDPVGDAVIVDSFHGTVDFGGQWTGSDSSTKQAHTFPNSQIGTPYPFVTKFSP